MRKYFAFIKSSVTIKSLHLSEPYKFSIKSNCTSNVHMHSLNSNNENIISKQKWNAPKQNECAFLDNLDEGFILT